MERDVSFTLYYNRINFIIAAETLTKTQTQT